MKSLQQTAAAAELDTLLCDIIDRALKREL